MYSARNSHYNRGGGQGNQAKRYNTPGTFVASTQPIPPPAQQQNYSSQAQMWSQAQPSPQSNPTPVPLVQQQQQPQENLNLSSLVDSSGDTSFNKDDGRKKWMKKGYKISMREKRRRQNKALRRLITPKNALMVLNELAAGSQQECTVVPDGEGFGSNNINRQYVAILNLGGVEYSGKGSTKLMAKNMAAESVIRDMILKQTTPFGADKTDNSTNGEVKMETEEKDDNGFPIIQLASYAIHKLFTEWQTEGYKVPLFGGAKNEENAINASMPGPVMPSKPKKTPTLPTNPESLHPCTLLSQMRGTLEYMLLEQEGNPPNRQKFTMGVSIDGKTYSGKAVNKKEARKQAAKKACVDLFGIIYPDGDEEMGVEN